MTNHLIKFTCRTDKSVPKKIHTASLTFNTINGVKCKNPKHVEKNVFLGRYVDHVELYTEEV